MIARDNFPSDVKWYNGAGCMICGSNYSEGGEKIGVQAVDFEMDDPFGRLGLCFSHAREAGRLVNMLPSEDAEAAMSEAQALHEQAVAEMEAADVVRQAAAEDLAVVERLVARFQPEPVEEAKPAPKAKAAAK